LPASRANSKPIGLKNRQRSRTESPRIRKSGKVDRDVCLATNLKCYAAGLSGRAGPLDPPRTLSGAPRTSRPAFRRISAPVTPGTHPPTRGLRDCGLSPSAASTSGFDSHCPNRAVKRHSSA
jgi:hypothetical protein